MPTDTPFPLAALVEQAKQAPDGQRRELSAEQIRAHRIDFASPAALLDLHAKLEGFRREIEKVRDDFADDIYGDRLSLGYFNAASRLLALFDAAVDLGSTEGGKGEAKTP
jgi:MoxR-like ATPase